MNEDTIKQIISYYMKKLWSKHKAHEERRALYAAYFRGDLEAVSYDVETVPMDQILTVNMHQTFPICTCGANINPFMYVHKRECPVAIQMSGEMPEGKVKCPATHEPKQVCVLCKNTNLVDEL